MFEIKCHRSTSTIYLYICKERHRKKKTLKSDGKNKQLELMKHFFKQKPVQKINKLNINLEEVYSGKMRIRSVIFLFFLNHSDKRCVRGKDFSIINDFLCVCFFHNIFHTNFEQFYISLQCIQRN